MKKTPLLIALSFLLSCGSYAPSNDSDSRGVRVGAERLSEYLHLLDGKDVGVVANHSSVINNLHLVDSLLALGVNVVKIYSPEHGFRGKADAGELIGNHTDSLTGLPIISLYGSNRKPTQKNLEGIDIILFDMQDVGVRYYTYISTMHYVMEACAENSIPLIILDRPNPNGFYVDGSILDTNYQSFVGMHPVPLVHGMTIGEFARMINGEGWLNNGLKCDLTIIPCANYTHDSTYTLPIRPSPNLPNQTSVYLYPSLGLFEGTVISVGRGTDFPFQVFGHPDFPTSQFQYTPESRPGASKNPPFLGITCNGVDLKGYNHHFFYSQKAINLEWLIYAYNSFPNKDEFFNSFFNLLAGGPTLKQQIKDGLSPEEISSTWSNDISEFMKIRSNYLLYPDFTNSDNE